MSEESGTESECMYKDYNENEDENMDKKTPFTPGDETKGAIL